jgi:hypothetical protein
MPVSALSSHSSALSESSFPYTLSDALKLAQTVLPGHEADELTFALIEIVECDFDGRPRSETFNIQRWRFRRIHAKWILENALESGMEGKSELHLLFQQFSSYLTDPRHSRNELHLVNATELASIYYGFEYPVPRGDMLVAYVPADIFEVSKAEAIKLGYRVVP